MKLPLIMGRTGYWVLDPTGLDLSKVTMRPGAVIPYSAQAVRYLPATVDWSEVERFVAGLDPT